MHVYPTVFHRSLVVLAMMVLVGCGGGGPTTAMVEKIPQAPPPPIEEPAPPVEEPEPTPTPEPTPLPPASPPRVSPFTGLGIVEASKTGTAFTAMQTAARHVPAIPQGSTTISFMRQSSVEHDTEAGHTEHLPRATGTILAPRVKAFDLRVRPENGQLLYTASLGNEAGLNGASTARGTVTGTVPVDPDGTTTVELNANEALLDDAHVWAAVETTRTADSTNWLIHGLWLVLPDDADSTVTPRFGALVNLHETELRLLATALTGTATYRGVAAGLYANTATGTTGAYDALATLTADFGTAAEPGGTITGELSSPRVNGRAMGRPIRLGTVTLPVNGHTFTGDATLTSETETLQGKWGGRFYGAGSGDQPPPQAAGTFGVAGATEAIVGTFQTRHDQAPPPVTPPVDPPDDQRVNIVVPLGPQDDLDYAAYGAWLTVQMAPLNQGGTEIFNAGGGRSPFFHRQDYRNANPAFMLNAAYTGGVYGFDDQNRFRTGSVRLAFAQKPNMGNVTMTATFSGIPAMGTIESDISVSSNGIWNLSGSSHVFENTIPVDAANGRRIEWDTFITRGTFYRGGTWAGGTVGGRRWVRTYDNPRGVVQTFQGVLSGQPIGGVMRRGDRGESDWGSQGGSPVGPGVSPVPGRRAGEGVGISMGLSPPFAFRVYGA